MPKYYFKLLASSDRQLVHSRKFLTNIQSQETTSKQNCKDVPSNATIREEHIKCGKSCLMCPHGPYYYAYWKEDNGKLKKKYIGTKYEETWKKSIKKKNKAHNITSESLAI
jgi:hypothetical protein